MKTLSTGGLAAILVLAAAPAALAGGYGHPPKLFSTVGNMHVFQLGPPGPAVIGASVLTRDERGVDATVSTTALVPGGAYSWWWVVFNNPKYCVGGCGLDDLPVGATPISNGDPRVRASLLWGGGFVADDSGTATAAARLQRGAPPGEVRFGPGLSHLRKSEIHIVLRSHGPAVAGEVAGQIGSFDGGCTPEEVEMKTCGNANVQTTAHPGKEQF